MSRFPVWTKLSFFVISASFLTLFTGSKPANALTSLSFQSTNSAQTFSGNILIDEEEQGLPQNNFFISLYPDAVEKFNVTDGGSFLSLADLNLGVVNRVARGRDFLSFLSDTRELATFAFDDSQQFGSAADLEAVLASLDGAKATVTSSLFPQLKREVVFSVPTKEIPESGTLFGLLAVASLGTMAKFKSYKN